MQTVQVLIIGGGFGGIRAALDLASRTKYRLGSQVKVSLVSDKPHFEYHASTYRVMSGHSPLEVCMPLRSIFDKKPVQVVQDTIVRIDTQKQVAFGVNGAQYAYDYLVLAVGSEVAYYNIEGLDKYSFNINTIEAVQKLKTHLHEVFSSCTVGNQEQRACNLHFVVVGGGPTGCEATGELASYVKVLSKRHGINSSSIKIDLIQSGERLLPMLSPAVSQKVQKKLEELGVNVILNQRLLKEDIENVYLKDMQMKTKTVIWTAGVTPHHLYKYVPGLTFDQHGKVQVNDHLQAVGVETIFIVGDGANTQYSGMAQTALDNGHYVATEIIAQVQCAKNAPYIDHKPLAIIPVSQNWAVTTIGGMTISGKAAVYIRKLRDWLFFTSILPFRQAALAYNSDKKLCEDCPVCAQYEHTDSSSR